MTLVTTADIEEFKRNHPDIYAQILRDHPRAARTSEILRVSVDEHLYPVLSKKILEMRDKT